MVEIDIPLQLQVWADSPEEAEAIGDTRFAQIYEVVEVLLASQADVTLAYRYDGTTVSEWD